ncbi:hypothetical protein [Legionella sp. km772]|uniref:hypothetical protein n=1 Tax=Legionella sp. km772 TaxID=2498111 RepID=UPI000F8F5751|nr:hypothetical protein [Legionella sp. km772]RUR07313.1 hypothetical protein ELY15_12355 [Legionella sp. km772]
MLDIIREISADGDLAVLNYSDGKLCLAFKPGKGDRHFKGQFVIDLNQGSATPLFYSRLWDHPRYHSLWDEEKQGLAKPPELRDVPDEIYERATQCLFKVYYLEHQKPLRPAAAAAVEDEPLKEVLVFANTPKTTAGLLKAIRDSKILEEPGLEKGLSIFLEMNETTPKWEILHLLTKEQIKQVYDFAGSAVTGDWDGLALTHPSPQQLDGYPKEKMRVYNTLKPHQQGEDERQALCDATREYFYFLKRLSPVSKTKVNILLEQIENPEHLFDEFAVKRAGCITPHEFLFLQLVNFSYRDPHNLAYGEAVDMEVLQASLNAGITAFKGLASTDKPNVEELCWQAVIKEKLRLEQNKTNQLSTASDRANLQEKNYPMNPKLFTYLRNHLSMAIQNGGQAYTLPHPDHDSNLQNLFQHGFDMRNPYGSNLDGAWLMITEDGIILYGEKQEQLIEVLLFEHFLENNYIDISHGADMNAGWGEVIKKQIALGQSIPEETLEKFLTWQQGQPAFQSSAGAATLKQEGSITLPDESETSINSPTIHLTKSSKHLLFQNQLPPLTIDEEDKATAIALISPKN